MYQPIVLYLSLRYIVQPKTSDCFCYFISWFSTLTVTFGVMALIIVLSVMNGFEREFESNVLSFLPHALVTNSEGCLDPTHISATLIQSIFTNASHVVPLTTSDVVLQSARSVAIGVMLGVNPDDREPLFHYLVQAKPNDLITGQYQVILGHELAAQLGVKRGDSLRLMIPNICQFTPIGRIPSQRLFTVSGTFIANKEVDAYQLLINQEDASRLMNYPAGYVTGWRLWLQKPLAVEEANIKFLPNELVWHDWREYKGELFQAIRMEKNMMELLLSFIIIVATFNSMSSLTLAIKEKQTEISILQTQGLTRYQVMLMFITQGGIVGVIGVLLGSSFGILLASQFNCLLMPIISLLLHGAVLPVAIEPLQVVKIILSAMVTTLLSTIYPSWLAASIHPADGLRYE